MAKAPASGNSLSTDDARLVLGMQARGDRKHDVAAYFGVNQARIKEAEDGEHGTLEAATEDELPPSGAPGLKGRRLHSGVEAALASIDSDPAQAKKILEAAVKRYNLNE